jgi:hypothetical protein
MLKYQPDDVSPYELESQCRETLADRAAMSRVNASLAIQVNLAVAANVLSDGAMAARARPADYSDRDGTGGSTDA